MCNNAVLVTTWCFVFMFFNLLCYCILIYYINLCDKAVLDHYKSTVQFFIIYNVSTLTWQFFIFCLPHQYLSKFCCYSIFFTQQKFIIQFNTRKSSNVTYLHIFTQWVPIKLIFPVSPVGSSRFATCFWPRVQFV